MVKGLNWMQKVLTFPNALAATEIVNARFMTNFF